MNTYKTFNIKVAGSLKSPTKIKDLVQSKVKKDIN